MTFYKVGASAIDYQVPLLDILPELTAFKNVNGCFVQRRLKRANATFEKHGVNHYDDISIGALIWQ